MRSATAAKVKSHATSARIVDFSNFSNFNSTIHFAYQLNIANIASNMLRLLHSWQAALLPLLLLICPLLLLQQIHVVDAGRPLKVLGLFPHPGVSHFHFFQPIMNALAETGHDVSVVSHFPMKNPPAHYKDYPILGMDKLTNSVDLKVSR